MDKSDVVDQNLIRAKRRYINSETTTDADEVEQPRRPALVQGEAIHLHAHGYELGLANLGVETLATTLKKKFGLENLAGRSIVMHSCKTGQDTYGGDVLKKLVEFGNTDGVDLRGTTIYAPENYLVVEKDDGLSYVAKRGKGLEHLRSDDRKEHLQPLGQGWKAWTVSKYGKVEPNNNPEAVAAVMQIDEKTLVPKPEGKKKPEGKSKSRSNGKKAKQIIEEPPPQKVRTKERHQKPSYGFYDDPNIPDKVKNLPLLEKSFESGWYPQKPFWEK